MAHIDRGGKKDRHFKKSKKPAVGKGEESYRLGDFVFVKGQGSSSIRRSHPFWVAKLRQTATDRSTVLVYWMYGLDDLPKALRKSCRLEDKMELFLTPHSDTIPTASLAGRAGVFEMVRPQSQEKEMYWMRIYDPGVQGLVEGLCTRT